MRELDRDVLEAGVRERRLVLALGEGAGDAADERAAFGSRLRGEPVLGDDVRDPDPSVRLQHPGELGEDCRLVHREVDDAVRDDHVHRLGRERDVLHKSAEEDRVANAGLLGVSPGEGQHLFGHVEAVGDPRGPHATGRDNDVDAAARAEVEDDVALLQLGHRRRVPAAEACERSCVRQLVPFLRRVERCSERSFLALAGDVAAAASFARAPAAAPSGGERGFGVAAPHLFTQSSCGIRHLRLLQVDERGQGRGRLVVERVVGPLPALLALEQAGVDELLHVMADSRL